MARGNRRQPIVHSDADREISTGTLAEACRLARFETPAWVRMDNHYHWVPRDAHWAPETPKRGWRKGPIAWAIRENTTVKPRYARSESPSGFTSGAPTPRVSG